MNDERNRIGEKAELIMKTVARFLDQKIVSDYIPVIFVLWITFCFNWLTWSAHEILLSQQLEQLYFYLILLVIYFLVQLPFSCRNSIDLAFLVLRYMSASIIGFHFVTKRGWETALCFLLVVFIDLATSALKFLVQEYYRKVSRVVGLEEQLVSDLDLSASPVLMNKMDLDYQNIEEVAEVELHADQCKVEEILTKQGVTDADFNDRIERFIEKFKESLRQRRIKESFRQLRIETILSNDRDLEIPPDMVLEKEEYTKDCIQYCSLFPIDYEFTRDTLVWSWNAVGFINSKQHGKMDQVAAGNCFDRFIRSNYIVPIGYDHSVDQMRYKLASNYKNPDIEQSSVPSYQKGLDMDTDVAKLEHLSLISDWITDQTLEILRKCPQLKTLLLHQCRHSSKLERLLDSLFLELKLLKVLDLSCTNIEELPSSVENLKELRYLDMSETPIRRLPESIQSLEHLETLILLGCLNLCGLPKCMYKLISLKHLVLDIARMLQSMPMGIGKLTNLQTLSAFLVGTKDGNCIAELRNLNNLKGSLCILKLENILNKEESRKALLINKKHLVKVEYVWSDFQDARATIEEEILEHLQPYFGLQELKIVSYSGGVLPSWISDPSYSQLISITLHGCRYCEILPSLGALPLLKILDIIDMDGVVDIDSLFCRQQTNRNHRNAFPQLEKLSFDGMSSLEIWIGVRDGDFRNLQQLVIKYCPKLIGLPSLSHLSALGHLEISYCPDLPCLPEGDLPTSLQCIMLKGCPIIKERCGSEQGEDWAKIVTVPSIYIDDEKIN